jgi:hypothetical protein
MGGWNTAIPTKATFGLIVKELEVCQFAEIVYFL